ncbi:hypothetical protein [Selenomonas ruminantium]|uniref:Uncharacterized protein n=1 Tax=Selenomonas ruminantium TaxID=971 RepID=A0A1I0Y129_SELRU|nr:hypothetical protein [Selenomonas ruminantium]SFB06587.1 hypothetical protein SAMN05216587_1095 [Selenomonas ruminantium]
MEIVDFMSGREYRVKHQKLRITKITDLQDAHKLLVEAYFRVSYNQRINLKGFIPYSAIANEARGKSKDAYTITHHATADMIDSVILKLPVGIPSKELTLFEHNLMKAVCRTLVMATPTLSIKDICTATPAIVALIERIEKNGYRDLNLPLDEIIRAVEKDEVETAMELWSGRPFVNIRCVNGVDMVSASAELVSLFYIVSSRPLFTEEDIIDEYYFYDEVPEAPENLGQEHDIPDSL